MLTWTQIESAAAAAGWKRAGVEWRGPCPFCGGRDRAHVPTLTCFQEQLTLVEVLLLRQLW